jgi:hypothetical protein
MDSDEDDGPPPELASFADLPILEQLRDVHAELLQARPPERLLELLEAGRRMKKMR